MGDGRCAVRALSLVVCPRAPGTVDRTGGLGGGPCGPSWPCFWPTSQNTTSTAHCEATLALWWAEQGRALRWRTGLTRQPALPLPACGAASDATMRRWESVRHVTKERSTCTFVESNFNKVTDPINRCCPRSRRPRRTATRSWGPTRCFLGSFPGVPRPSRCGGTPCPRRP